MSLILECQQLSFQYGEQKILTGFNCAVEKGELVSITGASGCGKTTFLRLCAGLEKPTAGTISLRGRQVAGPKIFVPPHLRSIGYVFQNFALFEKVSVEKNIYYGCKTDEDKVEAQRLIMMMGLGPQLRKLPCHLSGGERQRVALARSLALKPDIMFLDEPFSSLGLEQTTFLIHEIKEIFKNLQVTALMVTHSQEEASLFATRSLAFNH